MKTLREYLTEARAGNFALAHFNIGTFEMLTAVVSAAKAAKLPTVIGVSEGERDVFGVKMIATVVSQLREEIGHPIFLNADHTYSVERVKEAVDAGFDAVIFDGAKLPLDENIAKTKECVEYARASGREVLIEGELGFIGSGSQLLDTIPLGAAVTEATMTRTFDAERFVKETGVDLFAPAVGNLHGMLKDGTDPHLSIARVKEIAETISIPLVLHGGSGTTDEDYENAIKAGISLVHVSTELRRAYKQALMQSLTDLREELAPYKYIRPAAQAVEAIATARLKFFAGRTA